MKTWQTILLAAAIIVLALAMALSRRFVVDVRHDGTGVFLYRTDSLTGQIELFALGQETKGKWVRLPVTETAESRRSGKTQP